MVFFSVPDQRLCRQGVALTRRNTTGPPCSRGVIIDWRRHDVIRLACPREAACRPAVECYRPRQTTDDDRYQRKLIVCPPPHTHYVGYGRASNECCMVAIGFITNAALLSKYGNGQVSVAILSFCKHDNFNSFAYNMGRF